jgi:hypothetical protein
LTLFHKLDCIDVSNSSRLWGQSIISVRNFWKSADWLCRLHFRNDSSIGFAIKEHFLLFVFVTVSACCSVKMQHHQLQEIAWSRFFYPALF